MLSFSTHSPECQTDFPMGIRIPDAAISLALPRAEHERPKWPFSAFPVYTYDARACCDFFHSPVFVPPSVAHRPFFALAAAELLSCSSMSMASHG